MDRLEATLPGRTRWRCPLPQAPSAVTRRREDAGPPGSLLRCPRASPGRPAKADPRTFPNQCTPCPQGQSPRPACLRGAGPQAGVGLPDLREPFPSFTSGSPYSQVSTGQCTRVTGLNLPHTMSISSIQAPPGAALPGATPGEGQ